MAPPRQWGWHQLDARWASRFVADAQLRPGSLVLDIGAGTGAITEPLVRAGMRVIAIEAHPERAGDLRQRYAGDDRVVVVRADAAELRLPRRPYHVVANPPFAITTPLLRRLLQPGSRMVSARLILQEQAARRWSRADARGAGRWSHEFSLAIGVRVPRWVFAPRPRVDSVVVTIRRR